MTDEIDPEAEASAADAPAPSSTGLVQLTFEETRVLGCLLEKEATTPDHYPLTLNSLHSACNQSSNRNPVTDLGTDAVDEALEGLRYKKLAVLVHQAGARVEKCRHTIENRFPYLTPGQRALLCVLFLRGQQTAGELRQRTERIHPFVDVAKAESTLQELIDHEPEPLVEKIPAGGGRRVATYVHRFSPRSEISSGEEEVEPTGAAAEASETGPTWREEMREEIESLRSEVASLRAEMDELKSNLGV